MTAPTISVVFTDLDNTLYDWVAWYSRAFYRMLDGAAMRSGVARSTLLEQVQQLYQRRHRLEEPEALLHAPAISAYYGDPQRARAALAGAFASYYRGGSSTDLQTYPGVRATLQRLVAHGVRVVGHTEAPANHAVARLRALGLEHAFVSLLAAPPALDDPTTPDVDLEQLPFPVRCLESHERKPNPAVLLQLCAHLEVSPRSAVYVGDSLGRDVRMARSVGMWTAWARYGTRHHPRDWERVVQVSPWTASQRAQARDDEPGPETRPDVVLHDSFAELSAHFDFDPLRSSDPATALVAQ
ncbi:MAG: HAD family hydrolase [Nannocystaceae bacterium]